MGNGPNFRRHPLRRPKSTVDGIIPPRIESSGNLNFRRHQSYRPATPATPKIDDFRRPLTTGIRQHPEGFRPIQQSHIASSGNAAALPRATVESIIEPEVHTPVRRRHKKHHSWGKIFVRGTLTIVLVGFVTGGFLFGKAYLKARNVLKGGAEGAAALQENVDPSLLKGEGDGRVNIMLLGKGGAGHTGADLTDTLIIASIDPLQKEASLLSIPRDLYVRIPSLGSMKINAVYSNTKERTLNSSRRSNEQLKQAEEAGIAATQKALEQAMGIPIHYHVMVDFEAFRQAIDTVGGVTINVKDALYDPSVAWENNNNPVIAAKGTQTFNGKKALLYARSRNGSPRGDFDRAVRQREIILALKDKVLSVGTFGNPLKISQLVDAFGNHVQTNLSVNEVMRLYNIGKDIPSSKVVSVGLADPPNNYVTTDLIDGQSVVVPRAGAFNFKEIQSYVRNTLKDGFLRNENASIIILNGTTTSGLASRRAEELKSFGYNVDKVADAPTKNYNNTILVDLRGGSKKYTRRYLEQRLNVTAVTNLPDGAIQPGSADFVIILGRNEAL